MATPATHRSAPRRPRRNTKALTSPATGLFDAIPLPVMAGIADIRQRRTRESVKSALEAIPSDYHPLVVAYALQRPQLFEKMHLRVLIRSVDLGAVERLLGGLALEASVKRVFSRDPDAVARAA